MRSAQVFNLVHLISLYFTRKVFNIGPLKSKAFRVIFLLVLVMMLGIFTFMLYSFFNLIGNENLEVPLILRVYSMTIMFWSLIIFMFVKILFMKSNSFLKMTTTLPVTMNERNSALLIFETVISIILISLLSSAVVLSLILTYGTQFILLLISTVFFSSIITYLILQLINKVIVFILNFFNLNPLKDIVTIFIFSLVFFFLYQDANSVAESVVYAYLDEKDVGFNILISWSIFFERFDFWIILVTFIISFLLLSFLNIKIPDKAYMSTQNYLKIELFKRFNNLLVSYVYSILRKKDTFNYIGVSYIIFLYLFMDNKSEYSLYALLPLAFNGIYHYVNTNSIRKLWWKTNYTVWKDYVFLISSQILYILFISLPLVIIVLIFNTSLTTNFMALASVTVAVFLFTLVGILFPPYDDNPFSVIISFVIIFTIIIVLAIGIAILQLSTTQNFIFVGFIFFVIIYFSIFGLKKIREEV